MGRTIRFVNKRLEKVEEKPKTLMEQSFSGEVKSKLFEKRLEGLEQFRMGFQLTKKGEIIDADPDVIAKRLLKATQGFGEMKDIYRIGPTAAQAWKETLWLFNDSFIEFGPSHDYTMFWGKELHADAYIFYARSVGLEAVKGDSLHIPPEWYMGMLGQRNPWMGVPQEQMLPPAPTSKKSGGDMNETR